VVRIWAKVEDALSMFFFFKINWGGWHVVHLIVAKRK
jgi:hypothetical protein